jgi:hypothetical protein
MIRAGGVPCGPVPFLRCRLGVLVLPSCEERDETEVAEDDAG